MIISPVTYGMPAGLTTDIIPPLAFTFSSVAEDDLNPSVALGDAMATVNATGDPVGSNGYQVSSAEPQIWQGFFTDAPLVQTATIDPDAGMMVYVTDADAFMALETGGEFEGVLVASMAALDPPWSIPRYAMIGTTLDCDTSALLAGSNLFVHDPVTGLVRAQGTSAGDGTFSIPVLEPGPHLVRAVNGIRTAISMPVNADPL